VSPVGIASRFAPSPTGLLHLGHAFSAILAHDLARNAGGRFLLRIEDIDTGRCRPSYVAAILEDLEWLGLVWDAPPLLQSSCRPAHDTALARLHSLGVTYPCFCTRADIAGAIAAPHGAPALYPGTCRTLPREQAAARAAAQPHAIRLNAGAAATLAGKLTWHDALRGPVAARPETLGDVVLARKDIGVGYMLSAVVDDAAQGVTDIVRGTDLFDTTHVQRLLQALLGLPAPRYLHHRLLLAADGRRLAKRDRAETLAALRARGAEGATVSATLRSTPAAGADCHLLVP
jgi:glutamyl-Q tRNA(Asp) synthetase